MAEAFISEDDLKLTKADIAAVTVDELRQELKQRGRPIAGLSKTQLQGALRLAVDQESVMSLGVELQADAAGTTTVPHDTITDFEQRELFEQTEQSDNVDRLAARYSAMYDQDSSAESGARPKVLSDIRSQSLASTAVCRDRRLTFDAAARSPTRVAGASMESVELQLQMRRLRAEIRLMEAEERERARQHELELRRLEI